MRPIHDSFLDHAALLILILWVSVLAVVAVAVWTWRGLAWAARRKALT